MSRDELMALASKVEALAGACRLTDFDIARVVYGRSIGVAKWTASIDAAMTLYVTVPDRVPSNPRAATAEALRQRAY